MKKSYISVVLVLIAIALLLSPHLGCKAEPPSLGEAVMARSVHAETKQATEKMDAFNPDTPEIYLSVKLSNAPSNTKIRAECIYITGEVRELSNYKMDEYTLTTEATRYVAFAMTKPTKDWPVGEYVVKLYLDGVEKLTVPFKVVRAVALPVIDSFTANPSAIFAGQSTTLTWSVSGADTVDISPDIGRVLSTGSRSVVPTITTTYHLIATNKDGSVAKSVVVTIQATPPAPTPKPIELREAETKELIKILTLGTSSLDLIEISLESKTNEPLLISILPGTIFDPAPTPPGQVTEIAHASMVVREKKQISLQPREKATSVLVSAASIIMHAREPAGSDALTLRRTPTPEEIMKLLNLSDFLNETFRIQQFAIWTLTNNPRRDAYYRIWQDEAGKPRIWERTLETPPAGWGGSPPSSREIEAIRVLFRKAGIPTENYQALR